MSNERKNRVVILCGPDLMYMNTCATLISAGVNVVGICICNQKILGQRLKYIRKSFFKRGIFITLSQIAGRLYYILLNGKKDAIISKRLYNEEKIRTTIKNWNGEKHFTDDYSAPATLKWLQSMEVDIFVVHTSSWVDKKVREIPKKKIVIGGHPGLVPDYRGSYSAFWAVYNGKPEEVGYSVFWLNGGVDTGDLIAQERIGIDDGDSHITLGWKGMIKEAKRQAQVILNYDRGIEIARKKHKDISPHSEYPEPTLPQYIEYRRMQKNIR